MTLAGRDSRDLSMNFHNLKSFGARLSDLSRTLAGDPKTRVSDLKLSTLNVKLPVPPPAPAAPARAFFSAPGTPAALFRFDMMPHFLAK